MHPCSPALQEMVSRKTALARLSDPTMTEPSVLEHRINRALRDLARTRPRIVEFAPRIALRRALDVVSETGTQEAALGAMSRSA